MDVIIRFRKMLMVLKPLHLEVLKMLEKIDQKLDRTSPPSLLFRITEWYHLPPSWQDWKPEMSPVFSSPHASTPSYKNHPNFPATSPYSSLFFTWVLSISLHMFLPCHFDQDPLIHPPAVAIFLSWESSQLFWLNPLMSALATWGQIPTSLHFL